jgi:hypothetical protein
MVEKMEQGKVAWAVAAAEVNQGESRIELGQ